MPGIVWIRFNHMAAIVRSLFWSNTQCYWDTLTKARKCDENTRIVGIDWKTERAYCSMKFETMQKREMNHPCNGYQHRLAQHFPQWNFAVVSLRVCDFLMEKQNRRFSIHWWFSICQLRSSFDLRYNRGWSCHQSTQSQQVSNKISPQQSFCVLCKFLTRQKANTHWQLNSWELILLFEVEQSPLFSLD